MNNEFHSFSWTCSPSNLRSLSQGSTGSSSSYVSYCDSSGYSSGNSSAGSPSILFIPEVNEGRNYLLALPPDSLHVSQLQFQNRNFSRRKAWPKIKSNYSTNQYKDTKYQEKPSALVQPKHRKSSLKQSNSGSCCLKEFNARCSNEPHQNLLNDIQTLCSSGSGIGTDIHEEPQQRREILKVLSNIPKPTVLEISARSALLAWSPPRPNDVINVINDWYEFEVTMSHNGKEGRYRTIFKGSSIECVITDLRPHTQYHIRVQAILKYLNLKGCASDVVAFVTHSCEPDQPAPPRQVTRNKTSIHLDWNAPIDNGGGIENYILEISKWHTRYGPESQFSIMYEGPAKSFNVQSLQPSTTYKFRLTAVNDFGKSRPSEICFYTSQGSGPAIPDPPCVAEITESALCLVWSKRSGDDEFTLQMDDPISGLGFLPIYNGSNTLHVVTGLQCNMSYKFRLKAYNEMGSSPYSLDVTCTTKHKRPGQPSKPMMNVMPGETSSFKVVWNTPADNGGSDIQGFTLEIDDGSGATWAYKGVKTECVCRNLQPQTQYRVRVRAESKDGISDYSEPCFLTTTPQVPAIEDETSEEEDFIEMPLMSRCHETLDQTIDPNNEGSQNESKDEIEKHIFHGCLLDRLQNLQIHRDEFFPNNWDQWNISETSSPDSNNAAHCLYKLKSLRATSNKSVVFPGGDVEISSKNSTMLRMRYCPPDDYEEFAESIEQEEGLCISSPIIQIEDFKAFLAYSCKEIKIRHNIYEWEIYTSSHIRVYSNLKDVNSYVNIDVEICKDYITVRGYETEKGKGESKAGFTTNRTERNESGSSSSSNDEGYVGRDESPTQKTGSLVHLVKPEDVCDIKLYFTREIMQNNRCPLPHEVAVYAIMDKELKIKEFLEKELPECGLEQAAQRIRVAIFKDQVYTPVLGESPKTNPKLVWDENNPFGSFSYSLLNQKRGFLKLQKTLPLFLLFCDRRKYFNMKLKLSSKGKPPDDHIYIHGAEIVPINCQKFCDTDNLDTLPIYSSSSGLLCLPAGTPDGAANLQSFPSQEENHTELSSFHSTEDPSLRKLANGPSKRRRNMDEIEQGSGGLKSSYCPHTLTRPQTLRAHIQKFHPQQISDDQVMSKGGKSKGKGKGKGKNSLQRDTLSLCINQQVGQQSLHLLDQDQYTNHASIDYSIVPDGLRATDRGQRNMALEEIETMSGVQGMQLTNGMASMGIQKIDVIHQMGEFLGMQGTERSHIYQEIPEMIEISGTNPLPLPGIECFVTNLVGTNQ